MKIIKNIFSRPFLLGVFIWIVLLFISGGLHNFSSGNKLTEDLAIKTERFNTDIIVGEDQSYEVNEKIAVNFQDTRHGIFRYVPYKGSVLSFDKNGKKRRVPYFAKITDAKADDVLEVSRESGSWVGRLGDEDEVQFGECNYHLSYKFIPRFQIKSYNNAYYNVFPNQWQNPIPKGSRFTVTFPKSFDHSILKFYYGQQGESRNAAEILDISWEGDKVTGTLLADLKLGEGVTFYAPMKADYFSKTRNVNFLSASLLLPGIIICLTVVLLYLLFGRDENIIPSIQYQPPEGLDSAAVGYMIDGQVDNEDVISLIVYWADKGYLRIEEKKKHGLVLVKRRELPEDAPAYQITVFRKLFEKDEQTKISRLKYKFAGTMEIAKDQIRERFSDASNHGVFTRASKISRIIAMAICTLPFVWFMLLTGYYSLLGTGRLIVYVLLCFLLFAGMIVICLGVDKWYAKSSKSRKHLVYTGIGMCVVSTSLYTGDYLSRAMEDEIFNYTWQLAFILVMTIISIWLAVFMKKRTEKSTEWMGRIVGLRDFIETAELDRMNELAKGNPEWFYHIIPYAYVFGLSNVFAEKLKDLSLPAPEWYVPRGKYTYFDYYTFNRLMTRSLNDATTTLTVPKPSSTSGSSGSSGGSFGGSSGGGGFSGGGFGGGGGGSW